jgi:hypothetical protein
MLPDPLYFPEIIQLLFDDIRVVRLDIGTLHLKK